MAHNFFLVERDDLGLTKNLTVPLKTGSGYWRRAVWFSSPAPEDAMPVSIFDKNLFRRTYYTINISLKIFNNIYLNLKETGLNFRPDRPDLLLLLPQLPLQLEQLLQLVAEQSCEEKYEASSSKIGKVKNEPKIDPSICASCALLPLYLSLIMIYGAAVAIGSNIRW